jgi:hypothetical protein
LAHGLAEGQLFVDGNKRVALAALHTFLLVNGLQIDASQEERAHWILSWPLRAGQPKRKSGISQLGFASRPFRILMRLIKAKGEKETVHLPGKRCLHVG